MSAPCLRPFLVALFALPILHADEVITLAPMEVTASRLSHGPFTQPTPVTTYTGDFLRDNHITDYTDLAPLVPGLFVSTQAINDPSLSIRGITSDSLDPRKEERVSVYQDGVPISRAIGSSVALFDLNSIEVFKGPQPTLFLRGVQSGAISITDNPARDETSARLTVGAGDYQARSAQGVVNVPVSKADHLFARVAVFYAEHDGYVNNLADGSTLQGQNTLALRTSLLWQPTDLTTVDLVFNHQHDTPPGAAFKSMVIPAAGNTDPYTAANLNRGSALGIDRTLDSLTATLHHALSPDWMLTTTSAARRIDAQDQFDADGSQFYLIEVGDDQLTRQLTQEIRLNYDAQESLTAHLGTGAYWQDGYETVTFNTDERRLFPFLSHAYSYTLPDAFLPTHLPGFLGGGALAPRYAQAYSNDSDTRSLDLFGGADYKTTDHLTLGASLRLTSEAITSGYQSYNSGNGAIGFLTGGGTNDIFRPTAGRLETSETTASWVGDLHALYTLTPDLNTYASVSRGRRPPALSFDQTTLAPVNLDQETVWNYEAGLKGTALHRRLSYTASVFQYYYDNFQTRRITGPGTSTAFDGGRARGQGLETTLNATVTDHLTLFGTYGYTDARFAALSAEGQPQLYAGNTFRLESRHTLALGSTLAVPVADHGDLSLSPILQYKSAAYFEDNNAQFGGRLRQGGFSLLNLNVAYRPRHGHWEARLTVQNLLAKDYLIDAGNTGANYNIPTTVRGTPRTVGAEFTAWF